jgi:hypothetical protein
MSWEAEQEARLVELTNECAGSCAFSDIVEGVRCPCNQVFFPMIEHFREAKKQ